MARRRQRGNGAGSLFKRGPGGCWIASWWTHDGKRVERSTKTTDRRAAERILAKWTGDDALRRDGVVDPAADKHAQDDQRPLAEHLEDFKAFLVAKGRTAKYAKETYSKAVYVFEQGGMARISALSPSKVQATVADLRDRADSLSLRTCNAYLQAVKSFSRWLVRDGRAASDVLVHLSLFNADEDPRYIRRDLTPDEVSRLIRAAEAGPVVKQGLTTISGVDRAMLYRVAAGTGFRTSELRSLTRQSFDLSSASPTIVVEAAYSKRGRRDVQPLPEALAAMLRPWIEVQPNRGPVFNMPRRTAEMMRVDLESAGIAHRDEDGHVVDFHSLRHTYVSRVVESAKSVKVAQELARHSTPTLTIGLYAHTQLHDVRSAVEDVSIGDTTEVEVQSLQATGTDTTPGERRDKPRPQYTPQRARETAQSGAAGRDEEAMHGGDNRGDAEDDKSLSFTTLRNASQPGATSGTNGPVGIRTRTPDYGKRILSPLRLPIPPQGQLCLKSS